HGLETGRQPIDVFVTKLDGYMKYYCEGGFGNPQGLDGLEWVSQGAWTMLYERFGNYPPLYLYADNQRKPSTTFSIAQNRHSQNLSNQRRW
ncbi:MAG: hypothetical protein J7D96_22320, partial [Escherichia coli]|nr:hypothetical protein [Escherichia coli]